MINSLRLLTLGGPRTWDFKMFQQVSQPAAAWPWCVALSE
jgi:hypothetical protein